MSLNELYTHLYSILVLLIATQVFCMMVIVSDLKRFSTTYDPLSLTDKAVCGCK